jgi:hypothetical protein
MRAEELDRLGTRVLVLTGNVAVIETLEAGRFPLLRKPFRVAQLLRAVRSLSSGSETLDALPS